MFPKLLQEIEQIQSLELCSTRKKLLDALALLLAEKRALGKGLRLSFICTHNSRRSHLAQLWSQALAQYFSLSGLISYSGGTEATAVYPAILRCVEQQGFAVEQLSQGTNPLYNIKYAANEPGVLAFSKSYHAPFNPQAAYIAILVCSQADGDCPLVLGADARFALPFEDPKQGDASPEQEQIYRKTSREIAAQLYYVYAQLG